MLLNVQEAGLKRILSPINWETVNIINDNSSSFPDICKDDISKIANYMTELRNVDGHLFSTEPIKNETGLSLKQIEKIADRIVFAIVNNKIMGMPEKSRKKE